MAVVNEKNTAYLTVTFLDKDGAQEAPTSISYRIDDEESGSAILAPTAVTPGASVTITITPAQNAILDASKAQEAKLVTITGVYSASDQVTHEYRYQVKNLRHVS